MQPILKPPGPALLKLRYDGPLSYSAFKVNLRHYTLASTRSRASAAVAVNNLNAGVPAQSAPPAGAYTRPRFGSLSTFCWIRWVHDFPPVY
jgi:hypothetical protein